LYNRVCERCIRDVLQTDVIITGFDCSSLLTVVLCVVEKIFNIISTPSFFVWSCSAPVAPLTLFGCSLSEQRKCQVVRCNLLATRCQEGNRTQVAHCNFLAALCQNKTDFEWPTAACCLRVLR
jgi:hypothetical protein